MAKQPNQTPTKKHLARLEKERLQQRYLIAGAIVVLVLVIGVIVYGFLDQAVFQAMRPVAKVGNETIPMSTFQKEVRFQRFQLINQLQGIVSDPMMVQFFGTYIQQIYTQLSASNAMGQQVVDALIEDKLVEMEARRRGITVTEEEVDKAFQEAFGYYPDGTPTPTVTATPFSTATLSPEQEALFPPTAEPTATEVPTETPTPTGEPATPTPEPTATEVPTATPTSQFTPTPSSTPTITPTPTVYSQELFEDNVENYVDNVRSINYSRDDLRDLIRRQLLRQKVFDAITADVNPVQEQVWARHILVATEEEAQKVLERLEEGETFADLARELSTDTSNKDQGGDLGWFPRGRMVEAFENEAFRLGIGEISQPVQTNFGYHIIQVLGHEDRSLDATQLQELKQSVYLEWLTSAKEEANVETYDTVWQAAVPTDPAVPVEILQVIQSIIANNQTMPFETVP